MTNKDRPSRFALNAVANWIAFAFAAVVGFFLSPYLVQQLGATRYGVWSLIAGLVGYLGLLDLGIRQAVTRYTARHHAAAEHRECSLIVAAALRLYGFLGVLTILLSGVLAYFAPILFNIPESMANDARIIALLAGTGIAVSLVGGVFGGVVTGLERFDIQCLREILVTSVRTVAIVLALREGYGLVALAGIQLSAGVLNSAFLWAAAHRLYAELRIPLWVALGPQIRTIISFSASLTVLYALNRIISYSNTLIVGAFLPIEAVTYFVIAGSLHLYATEMTGSLSYLMTPRVSALTSKGGSQVGDFILGVARIATLVSAPIAITFVVRGESFITLWMGPAFGPLSGEVLRILAIVVWLDASRSVVISSLTGMAKQRTVILGVAIEAACNLALSLALVRPFGMSGVALGMLIPSVLVSLGYIPYCLTKATGVRVRLFCRNAVLLPTVACLPFGLATAMIERFMSTSNLAMFVLQTILILPLVPAGAWFLCLSTAEKAQLKSSIRRMIRR